MRKNLKLFRVKQGLTQGEIADRIGCNRNTYGAIENGKANGKLQFWNALKKAFDISDEEIGGLMKNEDDEAQKRA